MELWIRSQDKSELVETNNVYLAKKDKWFHIYCYANNSEIDLGQYGDFDNKIRALEVLDEIQERIIELDKAVIYSQISFEDYMNVYEMPQE